MNYRIVSFLVVLGAAAAISAQTAPQNPPTTNSGKTPSSDGRPAAAAGEYGTPGSPPSKSFDQNGRSRTTDRMSPDAGQPMESQNERASDQSADADNTKLNRRDTKNSLTPMDQGNSGAETRITAAVRKAILGENLSFNAKNVKVITVGGRVTLRGPVQNQQERSLIEAVAQRTSGVRSVDNQLEVKQ